MAWAPAYASTSELASLVRIGDTADDAQLALAIETASRAIDLAAGRQFGLVAAVEDRFFTARWDRGISRWVVPIDDLMTSVGLVVKVDSLGYGTYADTITSDLYRPRPLNAAGKGRPWTELVLYPASAVHLTSGALPSGTDGAVQVTARWGWSSVPTAIKHATLLQASRLVARRDSPYGVAGSPEAGSQLRLLARLDPDVATSVAPYRRWWGGVA